MNDNANQPPLLPGSEIAGGGITPRAAVEIAEPVSGVGGILEAMLRQPARIWHHLRSDGAGRMISGLVLLALVCGAIYGVVAGSFSGGTQWWASPVKIMAGLLISGAICLPSLYIMACLSGAKATFLEMAGLVAGAAALMTVLLVGFAPVAWVFSQSTNTVAAMGAVHLVFWLVAIYFGLRFLGGAVAGSSRGAIRMWMVIYVLVMFQMTTALRPLIGSSQTLLPEEKMFFLSHWARTLEEAGRGGGR